MEKLTSYNGNSLDSNVLSSADQASAKVAAENVAEFNERIFSKLTPNSRIALESDMRLYKAFCLEANLPQFSVDFKLAKETIFQYVDHLVALNQAQRTVRRKLSSINKMYRILEIKNPLKDSEIIKDFVNLSVNQLTPPKQVYPLRHSVIRDLGAVTIDSSLKEIRNNMIFFLGIYTLCRSSELLNLEVSDIDFDQETAFIKKAKNDQSGIGRFANLSPKTVNLVRLYLKKSGVKSGKIIRALSNNGKVRSLTIASGIDKGKAREPMTYRALLDIFKEIAPSMLGDEELALLVGTHSLRIGAAVSMAEQGVPLAEIALAGGWFSLRMPLQYSRQAEVKKIGTAKFVD